jgi:hypothetical protein
MPTLAAAILLTAAAAAGSARADEPEAAAGHPEATATSGLFGFTEGSDVASTGEREVALEVLVGLGRRPSPFRAATTKLELGVGLAEGVELAPHIVVGATHLRDPETLRLRDGAGVVALGGELKLRLLDRARAPVGATLVIEPQIGWFDEAAGAAGSRRGLETKLLLDTVLVPERVFAAVNILYGLDRFHRRGLQEVAPGQFEPFEVERSSTLGLSAAIAGRVRDGLFLGGEVRYLRAHEGYALDRLAGEALFLGPTLHAALAQGVALTAAWSVQAWGRDAATGGRLDIEHFSRHQGKLKLSVELPAR